MSIAPTLGSALRYVVIHPIEIFVRKWNWKNALLSVLMRAPVLFATSLTGGLGAALQAAGLEAIFRILITGAAASTVQAVRNAKPLWASALFVSIGIPAFVQALQIAVHWLNGTPNLFVGIAASIAVSGLTSLFNWFAMRRGRLMVGEGHSTFLQDLLHLPVLWLGFVLAPFKWMWSRIRSREPVS